MEAKLAAAEAELLASREAVNKAKAAGHRAKADAEDAARTLYKPMFICNFHGSLCSPIELCCSRNVFMQAFRRSCGARLRACMQL